MRATTLLSAICVIAISLLLPCAAQGDIIVMPDVLYYNLSTTSRLDNFILSNQRQNTANLKMMETVLADFRKNYFTRLETVGFHGPLLEAKLAEAEKKLGPLATLDDVHDYCVNKYQGKLPAWATVKSNLATCMQKGHTGYDAMVAAAENTRKGLINYYATTFANSLKDCKKKFSHLESNHTSCVRGVINTTNGVSATNIRSFHNHIKQASCTATTKTTEVFDCQAIIVYNTFTTIGEVMGLIENCLAGHEFCPACGDSDGIARGRCPYHLSWHLADSDLNSETITNPFKGIGKTTPCLQINFISKGVAAV